MHDLKVSTSFTQDIETAIRLDSSWLVFQAAIDEKLRRYEFDEGLHLLYRLREHADPPGQKGE